MTVAFHTSVGWSPPTPMGLLPGKFIVTHTCRLCRQVVPTDRLVDHAEAHGVSPEPANPA